MNRPRRHVPKHIFDEIFLNNYWISYGVPFKDIVAAWQREGITVGLERETDGRCLEFDSKKGKHVIWIWTRRRNLSHLAHECLHAAIWTLDNKMKLAPDNEEAYCYLMEMLMRKAIER